MRSQQLLGNEPGMLKLLDDVSGVQIEFFRGNGWTNAQSSGDVIEGDSRRQHGPPRQAAARCAPGAVARRAAR